jgi:WD40 repeat protein
MLSDIYRFVLAHAQVIRESALHVYYSALVFTPHDTAFYKAYCNEDVNFIRVLQGLDSQWPRGLGVFLGHAGTVFSIAFSPDGSRLASASYGSSIWLWNATSGELIASLEGHCGSVRSVAFSPDGLLLASGSYDYSV